MFSLTFVVEYSPLSSSGQPVEKLLPMMMTLKVSSSEGSSCSTVLGIISSPPVSAAVSAVETAVFSFPGFFVFSGCAAEQALKASAAIKSQRSA